MSFKTFLSQPFPPTPPFDLQFSFYARKYNVWSSPPFFRPQFFVSAFVLPNFPLFVHLTLKGQLSLLFSCKCDKLQCIYGLKKSLAGFFNHFGHLIFVSVSACLFQPVKLDTSFVILFVSTEYQRKSIRYWNSILYIASVENEVLCDK